MSSSASRARTLLAGLAGVGLAFAALPASAEVYVVRFSTSSQEGAIEFVAPKAATNGSVGGITSIIQGFETTTGSSFPDSGVSESISGLTTGFTNAFGATNDNQLLNYTANVLGPPAYSNQPTTWFSGGGLAVTAQDGTVLDLFVNNGSFVVESYAGGSNRIISYGSGVATLTDLGAPSPVPGSGSYGFFALALGAIALKFKQLRVR